MTPEAPLAELQDAVIDAPAVEQLFLDLRALARVVEVRVKGRPAAYGTQVHPSLKGARAALTTGQSVQVRYLYLGATWCDTLMPGPRGVRVVRMKLAENSSAEGERSGGPRR